MHIEDLETPALLIDLDRVDRNVEAMASYSREHGLRLRPHTKTHKIPALARLQVERGAWGVTVAKVGEAEVMAEGGLDNVLIAYPVVGAEKARRVAQLALVKKVTVALDSLEAAECVAAAARAAGATVDVLVEIDTGFHRCGVAVNDAGGIAGLVDLASAVARLAGVRLAGLMFYPGHMQVQPEQQAALIATQNELLATAVDAVKKAGLPCELISGGSTPSRYRSHEMPLVNEIRPGTYIFNDRNTVHLGAATPEDCALSVLTTVVSTAVEGKIIVDGGSKTLSSDRHLAGNELGYGEVMGRPDLVLAGLSEEHGHISAPEGRGGIRVGDRLRIVMNHACACMHLHEQAYGIRGEEVVECFRVAGRGKLQ